MLQRPVPRAMMNRRDPIKCDIFFHIRKIAPGQGEDHFTHGCGVKLRKECPLELNRGNIRYRIYFSDSYVYSKFPP